jgi:hypothetical protein
MRVKESTIRVPQDASSPVDIVYWCDSNSECASLQSHRNSQPEFVQLLSKESTLLSVKESGKFSCDRKEPPPANSREFEKMSGGSGENIFKTNKQGSGAGGAQIPFAQIQPNNRMIMNQLKSRLKHNVTTKLYNQYDQEDRSPAKKKVMSAENAKVVRLEKPRTGVMLATSDLQSDSEYESDDEDIAIAHVYCIRGRQSDAPQSPLGEQTKLLYVNEIADVDEENAAKLRRTRSPAK